MIDFFGRWKEDKDYSIIPQEEWCDMDYMTVWIRSEGYEPKTTMENLIMNILYHYDEEVGADYFVIPDNRPYPENLMVHIPDVAEYVAASGGLREFDYEV